MLNLLLVEDEPVICENTAKLLGLCGFDVSVASNGAVALAMLHRLHSEGAALPDVVVTDLGMPVMDGFALVAALKEDKRFAHIPAVVLSARSDPSDLRTAKALGIAEYVVKPFDWDDFVGKLMGLLRLGGSETDGDLSFSLSPA